jgi:hypothetical protein
MGLTMASVIEFGVLQQEHRQCVTAAISSGRCGALEAEHRSTSALDATMIETIVEIRALPMAIQKAGASSEPRSVAPTCEW